jgi:hypothetical protein
MTLGSPTQGTGRIKAMTAGTPVTNEDDSGRGDPFLVALKLKVGYEEAQ